MTPTSGHPQAAPTRTRTRRGAPVSTVPRATPVAVAKAARKRRASERSSRDTQAARKERRPSGPRFTAVGTFQPNPRGFGFITLDTPRTIEGNVFDAVHVRPHLAQRFVADDVIEVTVQVNDGRASATRGNVRERRRTTVVGTVRNDDGTFVLDVDKRTAHLELRLLADSRLREGATAVVELPALEAPAEDLPVLEVYPDSHSPAAVRRLMFARRGLDISRPARVAADARAAAAAARVRLTSPTTSDRADFTDLTTFTIDGPTSRDLDDAISVEVAENGWTVWVHIADVASVVTPGTALDADAYAYATSIYLPGWNRPMLPPDLSEDVLSLLPGHARDTLTVRYHVATDGTVTDPVLTRGRITSDARLTYADATAYLKESTQVDQMSDRVAQALRRADDVATALGSERARRPVSPERPRLHAAWFPSVAVGPDESDPYAGAEFAAVECKESTHADLLIERLMVAANEAVATWLTDRELLAPFRVHQVPSTDLLTDLRAGVANLPRQQRWAVPDSGDAVEAFNAARVALAGHVEAERLLDELLSRHVHRAQYVEEARPHFGLASTGYVHFTSPIRRYADLVVHRVVHAWLDEDQQALEELQTTMAATCRHITDVSRNSGWVESDFRRFAGLLLAPAEMDGACEGTVVGFRRDTMFVRVADHGLYGQLALSELGDTWTVDDRQVVAVDSESGNRILLGSSIRVTADTIDADLGQVTWKRTKRPARRGRRAA